MSERKCTDDPNIASDEILFRGLRPDWIVPGNHGRMRIASAAFKNHDMSVLIDSVLRSDGRTANDALNACPGDSLCSITAGLARELGQGVVHDADPPNDSAHGLVIGKKTMAVANRFARDAVWVIPPEAPPIVE
ncbi:MAG: hypothetical protein ACKV22_33940 [Bryobacteraceae bacterium]